MTSKNGIRMWKPGSSVPANLPRRSTTNAFCCGTTTAVFAMTMTTRTKATTATISVGPMLNISLSVRLDPEGESVDALHVAALPGGEGRSLDTACRPRGPAQLRLADAALRDRLQNHGGLAHQRVDLRALHLAAAHPSQKRLPQEEQRGDRQP